MKIVLADDSAVIRQIIKKSVVDFDKEIKIFEAKDGEEAIQMVEENHPDVVFLDWNMPKMSGLQVLQLMRQDERFKRTPVIMVTTENHKVEILTALKEGASDYVIKPFQMDVIQEKLKKYTKNKGM